MEITQHFLTKKVCGYTGPVGRTYIPYPRTVPIPCCTVPIPCPYRTRTQKSLLTYRTRTQKNPPQYPSVMPRQTALLSYLFEFGPKKKDDTTIYLVICFYVCVTFSEIGSLVGLVGPLFPHYPFRTSFCPHWA